MKGATRFAAIAIGTALFVTAAARSTTLERDADACGQRPLSAGSPHVYRTPMEMMRSECPLLAAIVERFLSEELGEDDPTPSARPLIADLALAADFAALGDAELTRRHASRARAAGATRQELEELLYLTAVNAGVPRAILATRALLDLIEAQPEA